MKQLPDAVIKAISKLNVIGDLIGSVEAFSNLPSVNNAGLTGLVTSQIGNHDLIIVEDASADNHGNNAIYEATTTDIAGASVTWTYLAAFETTVGGGKSWTKAASTTADVVLGEDGYVCSDAIIAAYTANASYVRIEVNGLNEPGFTIDTSSTKKLTLTGYSASDWTSADTVVIYIYA
jgi:hypothetical protein